MAWLELDYMDAHTIHNYNILATTAIATKNRLFNLAINPMRSKMRKESKREFGLRLTGCRWLKNPIIVP